MTATAMRLPTGEAVTFRWLEAELVRQLKTLHRAGEAPAARARMSNLVIFCDSEERAAEIGKELPAIVAAHPARVLLLIGEPEVEGSELIASARVWSASASRRPIYTEQLTLQARGDAVQRLPFVMRSLLVGDVPTNLWWASAQPPPLAGGLFIDLAETAQQVIFDSAAWTEPEMGFAALGIWQEQSQRTPGQLSWRSSADLNWRRLKPWRRVIAQALDPAVLRGALQSVNEVQIEQGVSGAAQALLLAGWLVSRLQVPVSRTESQRAGGLHCVRLVCTVPGLPGAITVVRVEDQRLAVIPEGFAAAPYTISLRSQSLAELVGRQLSDRNSDSVFRESLAAAAQMATGAIQE